MNFTFDDVVVMLWLRCRSFGHNEATSSLVPKSLNKVCGARRLSSDATAHRCHDSQAVGTEAPL